MTSLIEWGMSANMKKYMSAISIMSKVSIAILLLLMLYHISSNNYLLFHCITEIASIVIGFSIFIITKNTYKFSQNDNFLFLGSAFAIVSSIDILHVLAYKGMGVFATNTANLPTQLWIIAKYLQSAAFIIFCIRLHGKRKLLKIQYITTAFYMLAGVLLLTVFVWDVFPVCYIEGVGLTRFKIISEYVISSLLTIVLVLLVRNRNKLAESISIILPMSLVLNIAAELCFTQYINVNDYSNMVGHILKVGYFYLLYKAIIETTLDKPYDMLFHKVTDSNRNLETRTHQLLQINKKLKESKNNYQTLLDFLPFAVFAHCNRKVVFVNNEVLKLLGLNHYSDILGKDILEFIHSDYYELADERINQVYNGEVTELKVMKMLTLNKNVINVETKAVPYNFKGEKAGLVVIRDIKERMDAEEKERKLKEALEYDRIKNEFMANISHELRTPLNVIFGATQLIEYYAENDIICENRSSISKCSKSMKQNSYRMLRLVNNLIDLTKLDSGFMQLNLTNENIVSVVEDITLSVASYIESKNITLEFDTEIEEKYIACDTDIIERIILNLLSNAVKFTPPEGEISVNIYDKGEHVEISVKDSGIGIAEDKQQLIFDRFRQVDKSLTRNTEGSGIGLNLVKSLVNLHEGEISVHSKVGCGSEFIIKLPAVLTAEDEVAVTRDIPKEKVERINIEFSDIYS
jgi:PAS domain S-box-containing protein